MKTKFFYWVILLFAQLCINSSIFAQSTTWDKTYSFPGNDDSYFCKAIQMNNGDLLLAGYTEDSWYGNSPGYMRIDSNGTKIWAYSFGLPVSCQQITKTIEQFDENTFYSFCFNPFDPMPVKTSKSRNEILNDSWLLKLNSNGDTLWKLFYDEIGWVNDLLYDNGNLVVVGSTNYKDEELSIYYSKTTILVIDTVGNIISRNEYLTDFDSRANSIVKQINGRYLITGTTFLNFELGMNNYPDKMYIIETDTIGNLTWTFFSDDQYSDGQKIIHCSDGNYAIIGDGYNTATNNKDIILWRLDENKVIFQKTYYNFSSSDDVYSIKQASDSGFIICGSIWMLGPPSRSVFFYMKTDNESNEEWFWNDEGTYHCACDVLVNNNSGYYIAGYDMNNAKLVKTDLQGNGLITAIDNKFLNPSPYEIEIFPNPGNEYFILRNTKPFSNYTLSLFNIHGNILTNQKVETGLFYFDTSSLPSGMYFYRLIGYDNHLQFGAWIKK